ncbi:MAG: homoserine O-succinyltransferase [Ruminococcus sp.]|jgi:homoserine O-succinyltransferase|nr:homoserine O-succinyltransferase [Ruminococcus sp.]
MPIRIKKSLPAFELLSKENIFVISEKQAEGQDIRPLRIGILNLMPKKIETETQILRMLSNTPLQVDIELIKTSHISKNTSEEHLTKFYKNFDEVSDQYFDGLIITGAPVENLPFEEVDYWNELTKILEWTKSHVYSTMHICWGAQAALYYHYGVKKYPLEKKKFGIFPHHLTPESYDGHSMNPLVRGFDEKFWVPHSRHTEVRAEDIKNTPGLVILAESTESGVHIVTDRTERQIFVMGHMEYDRGTLANEYFRDLERGDKIAKPENYFPYGEVDEAPNFIWRCHANLMYSNWLNYCVYQRTPFVISEITPI